MKIGQVNLFFQKKQKNISYLKCITIFAAEKWQSGRMRQS